MKNKKCQNGKNVKDYKSKKKICKQKEELYLSNTKKGIEILYNTQKVLYGCNSFFPLTNFSLFVFLIFL